MAEVVGKQLKHWVEDFLGCPVCGVPMELIESVIGPDYRYCPRDSSHSEVTWLVREVTITLPASYRGPALAVSPQENPGHE